MADINYEMVMCIVNTGFSDMVMKAARNAGATGGTVIHARGTANKQAELKYGITIQPEKDVVILIVSAEIKDDVLHALYKDVGTGTLAQGIAFSVPVDNAVGIKKYEPEQAKEEKQ